MGVLAIADPAVPKRRPLFGRAKGKTLRAHHAGLVANLLPRLEVAPAALRAGVPLFDFKPRELWLEIGFGGGEHLVARARENLSPDENISHASRSARTEAHGKSAAGADYKAGVIGRRYSPHDRRARTVTRPSVR